MRRIFFCFSLSSLVFAAACQPAARVSDTVSGIDLTASGALNEVSSRGMQAVQPIVETAQDVQKMAQNLENGLRKINEGKKQIQEGLSY